MSINLNSPLYNKTEMLNQNAELYFTHLQMTDINWALEKTYKENLLCLHDLTVCNQNILTQFY